MSRVVVLDRIISDRIPSLATSAEVAGFEKVPFAERVAARSTYDAIKLGGALKPDAPALQFLTNARADETPIVTSHREFLAQVTQAANLFHALGVGPNDVVSFLLPLIPEAFVSLFAAEAAGIANPVNPLLEPHQIAEILAQRPQRCSSRWGRRLGSTSGRKWKRFAVISRRYKLLCR